MEAKHTPGPWYPVEYAGFWHIQKADFYTEADVLNEDHYREAEANAKLCASAPDLLSENQKLKQTNRELLEALERIGKAIDNANNSDFSQKSIDELNRLNIYGIKLIQKAKGGE